jgi:hypothetical protein
MNKNWKQSWAVLLLAFLQCFAPLLHAHPGGDSTSHGVHFHGEMAAQGHAPEGAGFSLSHAADDEAAIGVAQEFRHDYAIQVGEPLALATRPLLPGRLERRNDTIPTCFGFCGRLSYILPLAQAPPAA